MVSAKGLALAILLGLMTALPVSPAWGAGFEAEDSSEVLPSASSGTTGSRTWTTRADFDAGTPSSTEALSSGGNGSIRLQKSPGWALLSPSAPPNAVQGAGFAYDPSADRYVMHAGASTLLESETYTYDPVTNAWSLPSMVQEPPARAYAATTYDPASGGVLVFGGTGMNGALNDSWVYHASENRWVDLSLGAAPPARYGAAMAYDSRVGADVLFGGHSVTTELVASQGDKGSYGSIAIDGNGTQHVAFYDETLDDLIYGKDVGTGGTGCGSPRWSCTVVDSTGFRGGHTSIRIDSNGRPRISYHDFTGIDLRYAEYVVSGGTGCASAAWTCTTVDSTGSVGQYTTLRLDASGLPRISYYDLTNGNLRYAEFVGSGGTGCASAAWECTTVDSTGTTGLHTSLALDALGSPKISYFDNTNFDLRFAEYVGAGGTGCATATWRCTTLQSTGSVGYFTSLALDRWGIPRISNAAGAALFHVQYVGSGGTGCAVTTWSCTLVETASGTVEYTSLAIDGLGDSHISYHSTNLGTLHYARSVGRGGFGCSSNAWSCTEVASGGGAGAYTSIALDPDGTVHIGHYATSRQDYAVATIGLATDVWIFDGRWSKVNASEVPSGRFGAWMVYDEESQRLLLGGGTPDDRAVWEGSRGGAEWHPVGHPFPTAPRGSAQAAADPLRGETIVALAGGHEDPTTITSTNFVGLYSSVTVDSSGDPFISHHDSTADDLKFAEYVGSGGSGCLTSEWTCLTVDSTGSTGEHTSIAMNSSNEPRVSYYDVTNSALRFAKRVGSGGTGCATATWECVTVDNTGSTGSGTSIAVDASGAAHISYINGSPSNDLQYARYVGSGGAGCGNPAWNCTAVYTATTVLLSTSIALNAVGNPRIAFYSSGTTALLYAEYVGSGGTGCAVTWWTCTTIDSAGVVGVYPSLAVDVLERPMISYHDSDAGALNFAHFVGAGGTGCALTTWTCLEVESGSDMGEWSSLLLGRGGRPLVVHEDTANSDLRLAEFQGRDGSGCWDPAWSCRSLATAGSVNNYPDGAADSQGRLHISYEGAGNDLVYLQLADPDFGNGTWTLGEDMDWVPETAAAAPLGRTGQRLANAPDLDLTLMFGGSTLTSGGTHTNELWRWGTLPGSGTWTSATFDTGEATKAVEWTSISFSPTSQISATLQFQVASNDDNSTWTYSGPGGGAGAYYTVGSGEALWDGHYGRYVRVRAFLSTSSTSLGPVLQSVSLSYQQFDWPRVELISPNGGEDWIKARTYPITWSCSGELSANPVNLFYSTNNGNTWASIAAAEPNDGVYNWTIPSVNTANVLVKAECTDVHGLLARDTSDASFAIDPPPDSVVPMSSPAAGAVWGAGPHTIAWDPAYLQGTIDLDLTTDAGVSWAPIARGAANTGSYPWEVPEVDTRQAQMRIGGLDRDGTQISTIGPFFVIDSTPPSITVAKAEITDGEFVVEALVQDNFEVAKVSLWVSSGTGFGEVPIPQAGDRFVVAVPVGTSALSYYVVASDGANEVSTSSARVGAGEPVVPLGFTVLLGFVVALGTLGTIMVEARLSRNVRRRSGAPEGQKRRPQSRLPGRASGGRAEADDEQPASPT